MTKIVFISAEPIDGLWYYIFFDQYGRISRPMFGSERKSGKLTLTYGITHAKVFAHSDAEAFFSK